MQSCGTKQTVCGICFEKHHSRKCQYLGNLKYFKCQNCYYITDLGCQEYLKKNLLFNKKPWQITIMPYPLLAQKISIFELYNFILDDKKRQNEVFKKMTRYL